MKNISLSILKEMDDGIDNDNAEGSFGVSYNSIESKVMKAVYKALSETDGTESVEVLSGAPMGANNPESQSSVKFEFDGNIYVVNIMQIDGELNTF